METYVTIRKINSQQEYAVCLRKLRQGLCTNLEGWDGEGDRKEVQKGTNLEGWDGAGDRREVQRGGDMCIPVADSC